MKIQLKLNKKILSATAMLLAIIFIIATLSYEAYQTAGPSTIKGLQENQQVTYKFFADSQTPPQTKTIKADKSGKIELPPIEWKNNKHQQTLLNLKIEMPDNNKQKIVTIRYNNETDNYSVEAEGLQSFETVKYGLGELSKETKADWSGLFHETELNSEKTNKPIKIAFSGSMGDLSAQSNPLMIKIQSSTDLKKMLIDEVPSDIARRIAQLKIEIPKNLRTQVEDNIETEKQERFIIKNLIKPLQFMAEEISGALMQYNLIIGTYFDAKHQLETQRDFQTLQAEAHRDYHPSQQMCVFGTFSRNLNNAESHADTNKAALDKILLDRLVNKENTAASQGNEIKQRITNFITNYCDPADYNTALNTICETPGEKINLDIDFARLVLNPLTLDIDFTGTDGDENLQNDIIEMGKNLYLFKTPNNWSSEHPDEEYPAWLNIRRLMAMENVAQNSYTALIGAKTEAYESGSDANSGPFMKKLIEFLFDENADAKEIPTPDEILGENPSYYAMMEMLTKKIYQDPRFYTNLYDKPANVERVIASLQAIQLMQNRDRYESQLRQEMLSSLLLEEALIREQIYLEGGMNKVYSDTEN